MFSIVLVMPSIVSTVGGRLASGRRVVIADFADVVFGFAFALVAFFGAGFFAGAFFAVGFFAVSFLATSFFFAIIISPLPFTAIYF